MLPQSQAARDGQSLSWTEDAGAQLLLRRLSRAGLQPTEENTLLPRDWQRPADTISPWQRPPQKPAGTELSRSGMHSPEPEQ